ncbi:hypothetical protein EDEG_00203 [Edhazardia aedis USNM 41457]|uniref:Ribosomal protein L13e n=1 Tax=Edhazardia aedis (strain USNM 41457) TaxID=1003232 RepID=J9D6W9_EDHAE|nr:hypothetical protein EDEG_00203 [Edhazardia aedis USNM 41457]|eukprot:EJW03521.1 hypothetical protein EDEG_00203 [Edhazardia aedis USNM 41457]
MKNNHPIPANHFKKTAIRYKTWFHDRARQEKRVATYQKKAKRIYPQPTEKLYPIVRCPTLRHNTRLKLGRGFTPEECQEAGVNIYEARNLGIKVDLRRKNHNEETFKTNVERIKVYLSRLVKFNSAKEAKESGLKQFTSTIMPIQKVKPMVGRMNVKDIDSKCWAYEKIRQLIDETKHKPMESK